MAVIGCFARNERIPAAVSLGFSSPMRCPAPFRLTSVMRSANSCFIRRPFSGGAVLSSSPWTINIGPFPPAHHCWSGVFLFGCPWERRASGQYFSSRTCCALDDRSCQERIRSSVPTAPFRLRVCRLPLAALLVRRARLVP